jgi:hypothetical protein
VENQRRRYPADYRAEAVALVLALGSITAARRQLRATYGHAPTYRVLHNWVRQSHLTDEDLDLIPQVTSLTARDAQEQDPEWPQHPAHSIATRAKSQQARRPSAAAERERRRLEVTLEAALAISLARVREIIPQLTPYQTVVAAGILADKLLQLRYGTRGSQQQQQQQTVIIVERNTPSQR